MAHPARPIPYSTDVRPEDTERAISTIMPALVPDESHPHAVEFSGSCPRCGDPFHHREWLVAVAGAAKLNDDQRSDLAKRLAELGVDQSRGDETFDLTCNCGVAHPRRPAGRHGCGARFRVRVSWP
jgi:hypothetical protein